MSFDYTKMVSLDKQGTVYHKYALLMVGILEVEQGALIGNWNQSISSRSQYKEIK
jgi:hypothetical protein